LPREGPWLQMVMVAKGEGQNASASPLVLCGY
jgi:hypothetical protein